MTTNQTIDGVLVSRELLERCARELSIGIGPAPKNRAQELRALLDADKVNNRQMGLMQFVDAHPIKPAAQGQGEPVAVTAPAGVDSISMKGMTIYCNGADNPIAYTMNGVIVNLDGYTLYAPGADPVAVVMPERREIGPNYPYLSDLDIEWNACLDEVKRLNK